MSTRRHRIMPNRLLGWLPEDSSVDSQWLALAGYDAIDLAAAYGTGAYHRWPIFDRERYASVLPAPLQLWAPKFEQEGPQGYEGGRHTTAPKLCTEAVNFPLTRIGWLKHLEEARLIFRLDSSIDRNAMASPHLLLREGFRLAKFSGRRLGVESPEFALGLALVALGNFGILHRRECSICFRLAVPGLRRCGAHSQSKLLPERYQCEQQNSAAASRSARRAAEQLDWPHARPISMSAGFYEEWTTAAVLWPDLIMAPLHVVEGIRVSLRASPSTQAILPADFDRIGFAAQLEALRSCIDPLEWLPSIWPTKIRVFDAWLNVQQVIAPGAPPSGLRKENASRLQLAVNLLANGKSKTEIADHLGISRSHLSQLFRRGARSHGVPK